MLSSAEAIFLSNSATSVMALQKLIPHATVIQPSDICLWLPSGSRCFQRALINKRGMTFYAPEGTSGGILKSHRPSV